MKNKKTTESSFSECEKPCFLHKTPKTSHYTPKTPSKASNFQEDDLFHDKFSSNSKEPPLIPTKKRMFSLNNLEKILKKSPKTQQIYKVLSQNKENFEDSPINFSHFLSKNPKFTEKTHEKPNKSQRKLKENLSFVNKRLENLEKNAKVINNREKTLKSEKNLLKKAQEKLENEIFCSEDHIEDFSRKIHDLDAQFLKKKHFLIEIEKKIKRTRVESEKMEKFQKELHQKNKEIEAIFTEKHREFEYLKQEIEKKEEILKKIVIETEEKEKILMNFLQEIEVLKGEKKQITEENNNKKAEISNKLSDLSKYEKRIKEIFNDLEGARRNLQEKLKKHDKDCSVLQQKEQDFLYKTEKLLKDSEELRLLGEKSQENEKKLIFRERDLDRKEREFHEKEEISRLEFQEKEQIAINLIRELKIEKEAFFDKKEKEIFAIKEKENSFKKKENELKERENFLNERCMNGDEYELKIMGLQMNEKMMKKKIDLEMKNYVNEINKIKKTIQN